MAGDGIKEKISGVHYVFTGETKEDEHGTHLRVWRLDTGPINPIFINAKCFNNQSAPATE